MVLSLRTSREKKTVSYHHDDGPIGGGPYNPNKHNQHWSEGVSSKLTDCALVLRTLDLDGGEEYRVGKFQNEKQVDQGLRYRSEPSMLNPDTTRSCFGSSPVFSKRAEALREAERMYPRNAGIKVLHMHCTFPA